MGPVCEGREPPSVKQEGDVLPHRHLLVSCLVSTRPQARCTPQAPEICVRSPWIGPGTSQRVPLQFGPNSCFPALKTVSSMAGASRLFRGASSWLPQPRLGLGGRRRSAGSSGAKDSAKPWPFIVR